MIEAVLIDIPGLAEVWFTFTPEAGRALWADGRGVRRGLIVAPSERGYLRAFKEAGATREEIVSVMEAKILTDAVLQPASVEAPERPVAPPAPAKAPPKRGRRR